MSDIKQFLVTIHDEDMSIHKISLTAPSGLNLELNEGEWDLQTSPNNSLRLKFSLETIYYGRIISKELRQPFPIFNLGHDEETTYQTYHRGFKDGWFAIMNWLKEKGL
jgi:hypothetical protein